MNFLGKDKCEIFVAKGTQNDFVYFLRKINEMNFYHFLFEVKAVQLGLK